MEDYELVPIEDESDYDLIPIEEEESFGDKVLRTAGGYAHTARAIAETGAGLLTGLAAFPISKGTKWIEYALSGGDLEKAKAAELRANERIQFQPETPEAQGAMEQIGKYALEPVFGTLREMGRLPGESWKSPVMSELGGDIAEIGGPMLIGASLKAGKGLKERPVERGYGKETVIPERPTEVIPERPFEEPLKIKTRAEKDIADEGILTELGKPERIEAKDYVLEEVRSELTEKPVVETLPEVKVETGAKEIVEPESISELSTKTERVVPEFEPTVSSPLPQGPGAKTAGPPDIGEDIVKQRNLGTKTEPLLQPAIKRSTFDAITKLPELPPPMRGLTAHGNVWEGQPLGGKTETMQRRFDRLGPQAKEIFEYPVRSASHQYKLAHKTVIDEMNTVTKGMKRKDRERVGAYLIAQQKNGPEILAGMKREIPTLTPKEAETAKWYRSKMEAFYEDIQASREASGMKPFPKTEDYFTFFRDYGMMKDLGFNPAEMVAERFKEIQDQIHLKGTTFRFAHARGTWKAPVELDANRVFSAYSDYANRHIHMSPVISELREAIGDYKIKESKDVTLPVKDGQGRFDFAQTEKVISEDKYSLREDKPRTHKFLQEWLDFTAGQRPDSGAPPLIENALKKLNRNIPVAVLTANLRSALVQPFALIPTAVEIGVGPTLKGAELLLKGKADYAMKNSEVLLSADFDVAFTDMMSGAGGKRLDAAREVTTKVGMAGIKYTDMQARLVTWLGAHDSVKGKMNQRDAFRYADDVVIRTQGSAAPHDISEAQRTTLGKTLSLFQTFNINQFGWMTRDVLGIRNPNISTATAMKKTASAIIGITLVNSLFESGLGLNSPYPAPIHEYLKQKGEGSSEGKALFNAAMEYTSLFPYMGGMRYGYLPFGPVGDVADKALKAAMDKKAPSLVDNLETAGKIFGVPGSTQIKKMVKAYQRDQTPYQIITGANMAPEEYKAYKKKQQKKAVKLREAKKRARY